MGKVIAIANQKGGVGYAKKVVMQSYPRKTAMLLVIAHGQLCISKSFSQAFEPI